MQEYTRNIQNVQAFQTRWNMTITLSGKTLTGLAGQWLVVPPTGDPFFMDDMDFEEQFSIVTPPPAG